MQYTLKKLILGSHLFFAREGNNWPAVPAVGVEGEAGYIPAVLAGGPVGPYLKPPVANPAPVPPAIDPNWPPIGIVQDCNIDPKGTKIPNFAPMPGVYVLVDELVGDIRVDLDFSLKDVSELFFESLLAAGTPIVNGAPFQPMAGNSQIRGWLKAQQYGQDNAIKLVFDTYFVGYAKAAKLENKQVIAQITGSVLFSPLNSGILTLA